jgi:hypothetical protein
MNGLNCSINGKDNSPETPPRSRKQAVPDSMDPIRESIQVDTSQAFRGSSEKTCFRSSSEKISTMKKYSVLLFFLLASALGYAQTTVNLADQCNCEVLSGTAVSAPGATAPSGADTGDIYVNTNTGTIYFWDGNSWELTPWRWSGQIWF